MTTQDPQRFIRTVNVRVLITQAHSRSSCDLTDPRGWPFFWKLALTCTPDPIRPTERAISSSRCTLLKSDAVPWSDAVISQPLVVVVVVVVVVVEMNN